MSLVYLGMEMIQAGKLFVKFDCWSNKALKKYEDVIQIMTSLFFSRLSIQEASQDISREASWDEYSVRNPVLPPNNHKEEDHSPKKDKIWHIKPHFKNSNR